MQTEARSGVRQRRQAWALLGPEEGTSEKKPENYPYLGRKGLIFAENSRKRPTSEKGRDFLRARHVVERGARNLPVEFLRARHVLLSGDFANRPLLVTGPLLT
jgi:hypothetical protein